VTFQRVDPDGTPTQAPFLVCETSKELAHYSELFVEPTIPPVSSDNSEAEDHPSYRSCQWEVVPEAWMSCELDFLEGFINE
jgi:hypothetical protein